MTAGTKTFYGNITDATEMPIIILDGDTGKEETIAPWLPNPNKDYEAYRQYMWVECGIRPSLAELPEAIENYHRHLLWIESEAYIRENSRIIDIKKLTPEARNMLRSWEIDISDRFDRIDTDLIEKYGLQYAIHR